MPTDPVCACQVDEEGAEFKSQYEGKTYYFCTEACKAKFDAHPDKWSKEPIKAGIKQ